MSTKTLRLQELIMMALKGVLPGQLIKVFYFENCGRDFYTISKIVIPPSEELWGQIISLNPDHKGEHLCVKVLIEDKEVDIPLPINLKRKIYLQDAD